MSPAPQKTSPKATLTGKAQWPPGTPTWMKTALDEMAADGQLHTIPPKVMAAIADAESGYEKAGAGINSEGYGGFFGLGATKDYSAGTPSASLLETPSQDSFKTQAGIASGNISDYLTLENKDGDSTTLIYAVNYYVHGSDANSNPTQSPDASLVAQYYLGLGGKVPEGGKGTQGTAGGVTTATPLAGITAPVTEIADVFEKLGTGTFWRRVGIFAGGAALAVVGLVVIAQGSKSVRSAETSAATVAVAA